MNYANMIEEKRLKQGFIIATLISTVVGTFTTGINLFDRLADKRRQHKTDKGQNQKIEDLERRVNEAEARRDSRSSANRDDSRPPPRRRGRGDDDELREALEYGGPMVRREYDRGYREMGERFAQGDLIAQTQLQSQIITLQSTVIALLEEALLTGRPPDVQKLLNASNFARHSSIQALRDQYQRLLQTALVQRPRPAGGLVRRISSTPELRDNGVSAASSVSGRTDRTNGTDRTDRTDGTDRTARTGRTGRTVRAGSTAGTDRPDRTGRPDDRRALVPLRPDRKSNTFPIGPDPGPDSDPLFCPYATSLQSTPRPLDPVFRRGLNAPCPSCKTIIASPAESSRSWLIVKEVVHSRRSRESGISESRGRSLSRGPKVKREEGEVVEVVKERTYVVTERFLVKCHRREGGFACVLCNRWRDVDALCQGVESLVKHIGERHGVGEYEDDGDVKDVSGAYR